VTVASLVSSKASVPSAPPLLQPAAAIPVVEPPAAPAVRVEPAATAPAAAGATAQPMAATPTVQRAAAALAARRFEATKPQAAPAALRHAGAAHEQTAKPSSAAPVPVAAPSGPTAAELNQSATQRLLQGHPSQAAELYGRAAAIDPRNEAAWRGLGLTSERLGQTDDAVRAFRHALALAPHGPNAETIRARLEKLGVAP
jgi:Flp pilus assembly protein TadD